MFEFCVDETFETIMASPLVGITQSTDYATPKTIDEAMSAITRQLRLKTYNHAQTFYYNLSSTRSPNEGQFVNWLIPNYPCVIIFVHSFFHLFLN